MSEKSQNKIKVFLNEKKEKEDSLYRKYFNRWIAHSNTHGFPNIFRSKFLFVRLFWLLSSLGSISICSYIIYRNISNFLMYEVSSKVKLNRQVPAQFPAVTFCPVDIFSTEYGKNFAKSVLAKNGISFDALPPDFQIIYQNQLTYILSVNAYNLPEVEREKLGFSLDELLISCSFNQEPCTSRNFTKHYNIFHGNCFRFNMNQDADGNVSQVKVQSNPEALNALSIKLFVPFDSEFNSVNDRDGILLNVHNQTIIPQITEGTAIRTGTSSRVQVKRKFIHQLPEPYNNCKQVDKMDEIDKTELIKLTLSKNTTYRQRDCFNLCFSQYLMVSIYLFNTYLGSLEHEN
jgi:hypothetical protein